MQKTGQTQCAYCGLDFTTLYQSWLQLALDHVVPVSVCLTFGVPLEWQEDCSNKVLACAACNGFRNRYKPTIQVTAPVTLSEFYDLRDHIFAERKTLIEARHESDRAFFDSSPWRPAERK